MTKENATFGKHLRSQFVLDPNYVPLNHGSLGTFPHSVSSTLQKNREYVELHPDRWHRVEVFPKLRKAREALARLMQVQDPSDLAFVQNASTGLASVLRSFPFEKGDKVLCFSVTYTTVLNGSLKFLEDAGLVNIVKIDLSYPMSDEAIVDLVREAIQQHHHQDKPIRMAVMDAISSLPAVRFPFEAVTRLVREHNILSLVDGAHTLGQIPLDITTLDPDFFVANLHKWLYVPRGASVLYVPKRNQHLVRPLSITPANDFNKKVNKIPFEQDFGDPGIFDHSSFICIHAALEFRESLGGEEAIMKHTHEMAVKGGALVAELLGTSVMENPEGTLTASMVNVELPLKESKYSDGETERLFIEKIIYEHNCMAPAFKHNGKWWVRLSGQVYNDLDDFKYGAKVIQQICNELQK
ncbi:aminotransferase family protein [Lichtheimia corymbifera JMRC:FSU:9682]|uniref:Aminotransferase family protein n=1 Tax=Lichtheimia corymbifera JMRC:FSU:9682 TaxID=1263082 RepID=A0A068RKT8_9FUNG|nr:aminotransferase family protein [Lichtheimia corymbifera JMRC:FSU:9682]